MNNPKIEDVLSTETKTLLQKLSTPQKVVNPLPGTALGERIGELRRHIRHLENQQVQNIADMNWDDHQEAAWTKKVLQQELDDLIVQAESMVETIGLQAAIIKRQAEELNEARGATPKPLALLHQEQSREATQRVLQHKMRIVRNFEIDMADPAMTPATVRDEMTFIAKDAAYQQAMVFERMFDAAPSMKIVAIKYFREAIRTNAKEMHLVEQRCGVNYNDRREHGRAYDGTEIWDEQNLQLERLGNGFALQLQWYSIYGKELAHQYELFASRNHVDLGPIRTVRDFDNAKAKAERAKRAKQIAEAWATLDADERRKRGTYGRLVQSQSYTPKHGTIDAPGAQPGMTTRRTTITEQVEWMPPADDYDGYPE